MRAIRNLNGFSCRYRSSEGDFIFYLSYLHIIIIYVMMAISESLSSLPLQVAVHLNICLAPFLFIAEICCLAVKYSYLSVTYKVILVAVLLVYVLVEVIRLFLGIVGNLGEKIPALSGFWTLSMVLQLPIVLFLLLNPAAIPVPFEIIMLSIHFLFLIVEVSPI
ncbi:unnamed protein product [Haemonchus placei]|uniref:Transmembrane protein n=1 Tax=Haemonchus placei TaxID=6290 RepID=A0A0N4W3D5_HAEPC|nr:unnamed protein product [Haemonchus placei]